MADFIDLGLSMDLVEVLRKQGIKKPTPIQEKSIGELLNGKDLVGQAQTGTGKTLAFLLPIIEGIDIEKDYIQGLIVAPTRELALQITQEAKKLQKYKDIKILACYGGQDVEQQVRKLKNGIHLVIATPGRLLDHLRRGTINLGRTKFVVLDEADEMLMMGFLGEIEDIIMSTPKTKQIMLFSATIPNEIKGITRRFMTAPVRIEVKPEDITLDGIDQVIIETTDRQKLNVLCDIIDEKNPYLAIVFCRTKRRVSALYEDLAMRGYNVDELHGDLSQAKRERVMKRFRNADIQILVATDIAARGLDIEGVTHVINYDIPESSDTYVHRIGRTGRIGNLGTAITLVTEQDREELGNIERKIKRDLKKKSPSKSKRPDLRAKKTNKSKKNFSEKSKDKYFGKRKDKKR